MILKQCLLVLLAMFLIMGCVGAVSAEYIPDITEFEAAPDSGYAPLEVTFTFSATNTTIFSINYGDGSSLATDVESGVTHPYSTAGSYTATLTATNESEPESEPDISTVSITVNAVIPLDAAFTASPTSGTYPLTVEFTDTSEGSQIEHWNWEFGDGATATQQNPSHIFTSNGTYIVNLTITNSTEASDTYSRTITVSAPTIIDSVVITGVTAPVYGATPVTTASTSTSGVNSPSVTWTSSPTTFAANATYMATIVVQTSSSAYVFNTSTPSVSLNGATASTANVTRDSDTQITVTYTFPATAAISLPTITLSAYPTSGTVPLSVRFDYSVINYETYSWTYGDGSSATFSTMDGSLNHTYTSAGTYTANLTATNAANETVYKSVLITVNPVGLDASFTVSSNSGTAPLTVLFSDTSTGTPARWVWDFGGLASSGSQNPSYTFNTAGTYVVKLTVFNSAGASDSYSRLIYVNTPVSTSTPTPTQTATPTNASLTAISIGEVVIPHPFDIIKEFIHLFYSIFDPVNYLMTANESNTT